MTSHDVFRGHKLEALSASVSNGLLEQQTCHSKSHEECFSTLFERELFQAGLLAGAGCQNEMSSTALHNPDSISKVMQTQIENGAGN